jgi:DNA-binding MarR family transcriptional regulator
MYRGEAVEVLSVLDDLRRIVRVLRDSSHAAHRKLGVTGAQLFVMKTLSEASWLSMNELAARTRTHQSTVSVVVKRLVARGLVHRKVSAADARSVELRVAKRGQDLLSKAPDAAQERLISGIERLPVTRRTQLASSLRGLVEAMALRDEQPTMFFEEEDAEAPRAKKKVRRVRA